MIDFKNVYVKTFLALASDEKLLELLEIDLSDITDKNDRMILIRKSIIESSAPDEILNKYNTRLCIHEKDGGYEGLNQEVSYLAVDIHITKDKDKKNRMGLQIMRRVIEVLDTRERKRRGLTPLPVGLVGLRCKSHEQNKSRSNDTGWEKYSIVFEYRHLSIGGN